MRTRAAGIPGILRVLHVLLLCILPGWLSLTAQTYNNPGLDPGNLTTYRGQNYSTFYFIVTGSTTGSLWGDGIAYGGYTDDSNLATAAVHMGAIGAGQTAVIRVTIQPGMSSYASTTRYGITSSSYGVWSGSFANIAFYSWAAPKVASQSSSQSVSSGSSISLSVSAVGTATLNYQWYKDNVTLSGQTSSTLSFSGVQASSAGTYKCRIVNSYGEAYSADIVLTILGVPVITSGPGSIFRAPGTSASFSVTATGGSLSYQWYKNSNAISGAVSSSYTIPSVAVSDSGYYQVKVWNGSGTAWSTNALLTTVIAPVITQQPTNTTGTAGLPVAFSVTVTGSPPVYQWRKQLATVELPTPYAWWKFDEGSGTTISDSSGNGRQGTATATAWTTGLNGGALAFNDAGAVNLGLPPLAPPWTASFWVKRRADRSTQGLLYDASIGFVKLEQYYNTHKVGITSLSSWGDHYFNYSTPTGQWVHLTLVCADGQSSLYVNGVLTDSATRSMSLPLSMIGGPGGDALAADLDETRVFSKALTAGEVAALYSSGVAGWTNIAGATSTNLTFAPVSVADAGVYSVVVTNAAGSVTSASATLTVLTPLSFTTQPVGGILPVGTNTLLSVAATGSTPITCQWQFNSASIAGATNTSLSLTNLRLANSGAYRAILSNAAGKATSSVAVVTVMVPPAFTTSPQSIFTNLGSAVTFSATVGSAGSVRYQWFFKGEPLPDATNASLVLPRAQASQAGDYWVRARNPVGTIESRRVWLVLGPLENTMRGWGDSSSGQTQFSSSWTNLVSLQAGLGHVLGLRGDGLVLATGANESAQSAVPNGLPRAVRIAAGSEHSVALGEDGRVYAWGDSAAGQTAVPASLSNVVAIAAGATHTVALTGDGNLVLWGGDAPEISAVPEAATNVASVAAAARFTAALRRDGQAIIWGAELNGLDTLPEGATNLLALSASASHIVGLRGDGSVIAWGDDTYGQVTVPTGVTNATAISAGAWHSAAILGTGELASWGAGLPAAPEEWPHFGQSTPPADVTRGTAVACGTYFTVASVPTAPRFVNVPAARVGYVLGQSLGLDARSEGSLPMSYQWFKDGVAIQGQTNAILPLGPLGPYAGAVYSATVVNAGGELSTGPISLECDTPYEPLEIVQQPQSLNTVRQGNAVLSVGMRGTGPIHFQWYRSNIAMDGATNDYLRALTAELTEGTAYHVIATNGWESVTSEVAVVAVLDPPAWAESYTNTTLSAGETLRLEAANTGSAPFVYQWFHNGQPLDGANERQYVIDSLTWQHEGEYGVSISNPVGSITRTFVKLHVVSPPYLLTNLQDAAAPRGSNATFTVHAGGEPPLSFIWYRNDVLLPDEFRTNMVLPAISDADTNHIWQVVVTNFMGSVTSRVASLSIIEPPVVITQPVSIVAEPNTEARFSAAFGGTQPMAYQWFLNGARLPGATNTALVIASVSASKQGGYTLEASNPAGIATTDPAYLSANVAPVALGVSTALTNIAPGASLQISAKVAGVGPFTYQWFWNDTPLEGQTNVDLQLSNVPPEAAGRYSFTVGNTFGSSTLEPSAGAEIRVVNRPFIESGPDDVLALRGQPTTFSVTVRSAGTVTYQWLKEGEPIAGASGSSFTIEDPTAPDAGQYSVAVANAEGTTWSGIANLTFAKLPKITRQPLNAIVAPGETAHFDLAVESDFPVSYQWRLDGSDLPGETNDTLDVFLPLRVVGWDHKYSVIASSAVGRVSSLSAVLTVRRTAETMLKHSMEVTQGLLLHPGWNSIYLMVQPTNNSIPEVLGGVPWSSVWMWRDRENSVQFIEEMSEASWKEPDWLVNFQTNRLESFQNNLFRFFAGQAYLIHLEGTEDAFVEVQGQPILDVKRWRPDSFNLTGLPIEKGRTPKAADYFRHSPAHFDAATGQIKPIYRLGADGRWELLSNEDPLEADIAYWFYVRGGSTYAGPVELALSYGRGLLFKRDVDSLTLSLFNHADAPRRLWLTAHPLYAGGFPLMVREVTDAGVNQVEMPSAYVVDLPAGTQKQLVLGADRLRVGVNGFESVMLISDDYGLGQQIPVMVEHPAEVTEAAGRIQPNVVGLWVGQATLDAVSEVNSVTAITNRIRFTNDLGQVTNVVTVRYTNTPNVMPTPASAAVSQRILFHNDTGGNIRLLSEVFQLHREAAHTNDVDGYSVVSRDPQPVLVTQRSLLSEFKGTRLRDGEMVGRRISSPTFAFEGQAAVDNYVACSGVFGPGSTVTASFGMSAGHALNPFRHKYHPDHDNLGTDFKTYKEEAYGIVRQITLVFDAAGSGATPASGYDELSGTYKEEVRGLHRQPIHASGRFVLRRFTTIGEINPAQ